MTEGLIYIDEEMNKALNELLDRQLKYGERFTENNPESIILRKVMERWMGINQVD